MSDLREAVARLIEPDAPWDERAEVQGLRWMAQVENDMLYAERRADAVLAVFEAYLREHDAQPKLGLATTHELITELMARADVAKTVGETWPLYSTVGGSDE